MVGIFFEEARPGELKANLIIMWREDNIIEEIVEDSNIEDAIKTVLRKRRRKCSFAGRRILADVPKAVERIRQRIRSGRFKLGGYREMTVDDGPKVRIVQSVSLEDRIVLNAVMNVVDRHLKVRFIRTTSASIKNRGTHDLLQYIVKDIKDDPEGTLFGYQFDITKFYESVDQDVLLDAVKKMFKDKILIGILEECIRMMPKGVSIGLRSSQGLCNLLLSIYLDHRLKDQEAVAHYYRYCDDGLVLSGSKKYLWKVRDIIHEQARKARLEIKSNDTVFPITEGIDFLGYVTRPDHVRLRKRNKQKFARKMHKVKSKKRRQELTASFYGLTKHADCKNLFYKLTGKKMKKLKDLGYKYKPEDGRKRFTGARIKSPELMNKDVIVLDYEKDVPTKNGNRTVIKLELDGKERKYFTSLEETLFICESAAKDGELPFEAHCEGEVSEKGLIIIHFT